MRPTPERLEEIRAECRDAEISLMPARSGRELMAEIEALREERDAASRKSWQEWNEVYDAIIRLRKALSVALVAAKLNPATHTALIATAKFATAPERRDG